jgi:hypothetical protein
VLNKPAYQKRHAFSKLQRSNRSNQGASRCRWMQLVSNSVDAGQVASCMHLCNCHRKSTTTRHAWHDLNHALLHSDLSGKTCLTGKLHAMQGCNRYSSIQQTLVSFRTNNTCVLLCHRCKNNSGTITGSISSSPLRVKQRCNAPETIPKPTGTDRHQPVHA